MKCKLTIMKLKESINPLMSNVAQMNEYNVSNLCIILFLLQLLSKLAGVRGADVPSSP